MLFPASKTKLAPLGRLVGMQHMPCGYEIWTVEYLSCRSVGNNMG